MGIVEDIENAIGLVEATADQVATRLLTLGDWGTAGPAEHPADIVDVAHAPHPKFEDGWWAGATRMPAHPHRVGGPIRATSTGVHTTDMLWPDWDALIESWTKRPGDGACANFLIGPDAVRGVVQFVEITKNANHLGGPGHGVFVIDGREVHPNLMTNGIEIHCAGGVHLLNGQWRLVENGAAHGPAIPADQVTVDPRRPGRGWHQITAYQYEILAALLGDLDEVQAPLPAGTTTRAFGEIVPAIAMGKSPRVVTHWEMDPVHRSDPWPQCCAWLRSRA